MANQSVNRRYDLDWLRILAVALLFFFHSARPFDTMGWHIKNDITTNSLLPFIGFIDQFHMPVFFLLSGASAFFALGVRSKGQFVYERVMRLFVPLVFAAFLAAIPQMYFERVHKGAFNGSFISFWPHIFDRVPNLSSFGIGTYHLWFLEYLFLLSLVALPLFLLLRGENGRIFIDCISILCQKKGILLLAIPLIIAEVALRFRWPDNRGDLFHDWGNIFYYFLFFLYGYILVSDKRLTDAVTRNWSSGLAVGLICFGLFGATRFNMLPLGNHKGLNYIIMWSSHALAAWGLVIAWLGLAQRYLTFSNSFLKYAAEAILPVYILHQTVIVGIAFYVVQLDIPIPVKFVIILVASFGITMILYEFIVRRFWLIRFMFGMRLGK